MKINFKDIPKFTGRDNWTDSVSFGRYSVRVQVTQDDMMREPWKEYDGHGPVSDWRPRDSKGAGERVLHEDRGQCLFYDFAAAVKQAKAEGWDAPPYTGTKGERAARAVERDYQHLRGWCRNDWSWVVVGVEVSRDGEVLQTDYCGGIESEGDYWREHAAEVAGFAIAADLEARKKARIAAAKETRERNYWAARDVVTV